MQQSTCDTLNIAHRGNRSLAPENTLAAARKGLAAGADMWELDVAMSADGIPYLIHDDTLERTSNVAEIFPERGPWPTHAFTLAELRQLDFGTWFNATDPFGQIDAGHVTIGRPEVLEELSADDLRDFYDAHYRPERMAVVVVGDVDADDVVGMIE